jgi:hypothetical protein
MHVVHNPAFEEFITAMSLETPETPSQSPPVRTNPKADAKAAKAYAKAMRPWYKKKRFLLPLGLVLLMVAVSAGSSGSGSGAGAGGTSGASSNNGSGAASAAANEKPVAQEKAAAEKTPAAKKKPEMTSGQENALESAGRYIDLKGFSKAGLIQQLSSSAGEGYSKADATYAANHVGADWNKEAVEAAKSYLDLTSFSRSGLIQQLTSSAGEKFTPAQARYAVNKVY